MRTVASGLIIVGGGVAASIIGLLIVRAIWPIGPLANSNEIGDDFITVLGTAYGVLVAFVVSTVWGRFTESENIADKEANHIFTTLHLALFLEAPDSHAFHQRVLEYAHSLVEEEWDLLARGCGSEETRKCLQALWEDFRQIYLASPQSSVVISEILRRLEELTDTRRIRIFNSDDAVPTVLWVLLIIEGIITVTFTYLLVAPTLLIQVLMTAALAATIGSSLYLIGVLNHPFSGSLRVSNANLREQLRAWEEHVLALPKPEPRIASSPRHAAD